MTAATHMHLRVSRQGNSNIQYSQAADFRSRLCMYVVVQLVAHNLGVCPMSVVALSDVLKTAKFNTFVLEISLE